MIKEIIEASLDLIKKTPEFIPFILMGFICWLWYQIHLKKIEERYKKNEYYDNLKNTLFNIRNHYNTHYSINNETELISVINELRNFKEHSKVIIPMLKDFACCIQGSLNWKIIKGENSKDRIVENLWQIINEMEGKQLNIQAPRLPRRAFQALLSMTPLRKQQHKETYNANTAIV